MSLNHLRSSLGEEERSHLANGRGTLGRETVTERHAADHRLQELHLPDHRPDLPPPFDCQVHPNRDHVLVRPVGELDIATAGMVDEQLYELTDSGFKRVVLDLGSLTFLDSTGLRLLVKWTQESQSNGVDFVLLRGDETIERVLDISGLRESLRFADGEDA